MLFPSEKKTPFLPPPLLLLVFSRHGVTSGLFVNDFAVNVFSRHPFGTYYGPLVPHNDKGVESDDDQRISNRARVTVTDDSRQCTLRINIPPVK